GSWAPGLSRSHLDSAVELGCLDIFLVCSFPFFLPFPAFHREISSQDRLATTLHSRPRRASRATQRFGFSLPAVFIACSQRSLSVPKPTKQNGGQVETMVLSETLCL